MQNFSGKERNSLCCPFLFLVQRLLSLLVKIGIVALLTLLSFTMLLFWRNTPADCNTYYSFSLFFYPPFSPESYQPGTNINVPCFSAFSLILLRGCSSSHLMRSDEVGGFHRKYPWALLIVHMIHPVPHELTVSRHFQKHQ